MIVENGSGPYYSHPQIGESGGVFGYLIDRAAFLDRVVLSIWGVMKARPQGITVTGRFAIGGRRPAVGGRRRFYARSLHGVCDLTGNPFELRYGRLEAYEKLPPFRLIVRSRNKPVTEAEINFLVTALFQPGCCGYLAEAELTFDVSSSRISRSARNMFTCARSQRQPVDGFGRRTAYVGSRKSVWQYKQYRKTPGITRLEFVLRRAWLRKHRIRRPCDLLRLRTVDLSRMISFRTISKREFRTVLQHVRNGSRKRELFDAFSQRSLQPLASDLRQEGVDLEPSLRECEIQKLLRRMQDQLLW